MAYLLLRLEGSAAGYSFLGRRILRSKNSFHGNNLGAYYGFLHRMMSTINSAAPSKVSPRLMLPPAFEGGNMFYQFYNLADDRVESLNRRRIRSKEEEKKELDTKILGCSHGWVVLFRKSSIFLSNPLTCRHIKLPPIRTLCDSDDEYSHFAAFKVILSCSPSHKEEECRAMLSYGFFGAVNRLAFCLPGCSTNWTFICKLTPEDEDDDDIIDELDKNLARGYGDTLYSARHKLFFCITKSNFFQVCDLQQDPPRIELSGWVGELKRGRELQEILRCSVVKPDIWREKFLVLDDHSNQLFLVWRHVMERVGHDGAYVKPYYFGYRRGWDDSYPHRTIGFDVHKIDWDIKSGKIKVTYVEGGSLDGLAMFIGLNHSFALPAAEYPGLIPNSIYFTDVLRDNTPLKRAEWDDEEPPHPRWVDSIYGCHDVGIFNYENRTFSPCYYPRDFQSIKKIKPPPIWFTSSPH